ncbi:MAG: SpoIIE family protein phosphatase [Pseudomonadota bacterium]
MTNKVVDWAVRSRTLEGQTECGDRAVVLDVWGGVLIAVVDGLGHGKEAAKAATLAIKTIEDNATRSFSSLLQECHLKLRTTRGCVMSLAFLDERRTMTWMGIGNVEGRLLRRGVQALDKAESLLLRTGVVGGETDQLQAFYPRGVSLIRGDVLVLATDGIKGSFERHVDVMQPPRVIAEDLIANYSKLNDDALVFVGRYIG